MKWLSSRLLRAISVVCAIVLLCAPVALAADAGVTGRPGTVGWPTSIASTGDSITRAYNTGFFPFTDSPGNSWSTGTSSSVLSHYSRILAANPGISGNSYNDAVTGAKMTDLAGQISNANGQHADYVTILLGANDACTATEADMTPVSTYRAQFQSALNSLASALPDARVFVLSVPNIYNLWYILKDNSSARSTWSSFSICQSMLANPLSTAQADIDRRARVSQRVVDYNTQLAQVCAADIHCKFDNNAIFNTGFVASDVSTRDYFHPTIAGQAKIAAASYMAGFDFTDTGAPRSYALSHSLPITSVVLKAVDNVGVSGIEYRLNNGPITRYIGVPIPIGPDTSLTFRAVDVNGNTEAWHLLSPSGIDAGK